MLSKYIQYFLDENNLEIGEEFMLTNENGRHIHPDKTFFFNGNPTSSRDILISKDEERFCPNILLGLLTGFYGVQKNMLINIKRINSLNVLLIGYLKLFPQ